jgi:hypothetical protein
MGARTSFLQVLQANFMNTRSISIVLATIVVFVGGYLMWSVYVQGAPRNANNDSAKPAQNSGANAPVFTRVHIALLDTEGKTDGRERGCDRVVMVEHAIKETTAPLSAAMRVLFSLEDTNENGLYNFIARTNGTLAFDRASVQSGTAHVYLTGELSGLAGVCDDPRAAIQIEETALQFPTVESVQIYLNEEPTDLTPDLRGE